MAFYEVVTLEGLRALQNLKELPLEVQTAASRALNATLRTTRTDSAKRISRQVNFTSRYLTSGDRLAVRKFATPSKLEGVIGGRDRATSLARFATSSTINKKGVTVEVKPGTAKFMRRAFLVRLPQGKALTETKFNLGLAIRLKPGETLNNKKKFIKLQGNLYLLYGPSVGQVFNEVRDDVTPAALDFFEDEFFRLMDLNNA
jgi:hypothetical protein